MKDYQSSTLPTLTLEKAIEITQNNKCFIRKTESVLGYTVDMFNYFLAQFQDFEEQQGFELRGLTFITDGLGNTYKVPHLHKFFNLNENASTQYNDMKALVLDEVHLKEDGSMLIPVTFPCGTVKWKSKMSWDNEQTRLAETVFADDAALRNFVAMCDDMNWYPVFELVSPYNKIVVDYSKTELILLQVRYEDGTYMDVAKKHQTAVAYGVKCVESVKGSLDDLIALAETIEGIEGWVLHFTNGKMIKLKTKWYKELHGLLTDSLTREDFIVENVLNETLDDVLAQVDEKDPRKQWVEKAAEAVAHYTANTVKEVMTLKAEYTGDRKEMALKYNKHPLFSVVMRVLESNEEAVEKEVIKFLLRETTSLSKAQNLLYTTIGFNVTKV
jgi:T4 RnlA family RNA ligase